MTARFLDYDPVTGCQKWFHHQPSTDEVFVEFRYPDRQLYLDHVKHLQDGTRPSKNGAVHHSYVPPELDMQFVIEKGINLRKHGHGKYACAVIESDPDYARCRVTTQKLFEIAKRPKLYQFASRKQHHYGCELGKILDECR